MTDGEMIKVLKQLKRCNGRMKDLLNSLDEHPRGAELIEELNENGCGMLWDFLSIGYPYLVYPERWVWVGRYSLGFNRT